MTAQALVIDDDAVFGQPVVHVVDVAEGREISWGGGLVEKLDDRLRDVQTAVVAGARAVAQSLDRLPSPADWQVDELSATFGITLTAEAGVLLSKAGTEATFEVTVIFRRA